MNIEEQLKQIENTFNEYLDGTRVLLLMCRAKDGGHNKEYHRREIVLVSHDREQLLRNIRKCLILKNNNENPLRLYMTCNSRNIIKAERIMKMAMLEMDFENGENKKIFYERFIGNWHSSLMREGARDTKYFLIDLDDKHLLPQALEHLDNLKVGIKSWFETKNGYHIITVPFNPSLYDKKFGEIKKDGQLLLSY